MNVYDFDNTILEGDSEQYFFRYFFKHHLICFLKYEHVIAKRDKLKQKGIISYEEAYDYAYNVILPYEKNLDKFLEKFWDKHEKYVKDWYKVAQKEDDIIISGTPRFILNPIIKRLNIKTLFATEFDLKSNHLVGKTCFAEEKVNRYKEHFDIKDIDNFYSDSDIDTPLAKVAKKAYKVTHSFIEPWKFK